MKATLLRLISKKEIKNVVIALLIWQSLIIAINGCIWNTSILTYMLLVFILHLEYRIENHYFEKKDHIKVLLFDCLYTGIVLWGIVSGKITFGVEISRLFPKVILLFVGGFFLFRLLIYHARYVLVPFLKNCGPKWIVLQVALGVCVVVCMWEQNITDLRSVAGYLTAVILLENIALIQGEKHSRKGIVLLFSCLFSLFSTMGSLNMLALQLGDEEFSNKMLFCLMILFIFWSVVYYFALLLVIRFIDNYKGDNKQCKGSYRVSEFLSVMGISFICWLPYLLSYFPGFISKDSIAQLSQVFGVSTYSNHHPWLHTMLIKIFYTIGKGASHSTYIGIATYSIFSMIFMSFVFTSVLSKLRSKGIPFIYRLLTFIFYVIFPINAMYSMTMWKDVIFSGVMTLYILVILKLFEDEEKGKLSINHLIQFIIISFCVCFMRSNGIYAWFLSVPFIVYYFRKYYKVIVPVIGIIFMLILFYKNEVLIYYQVEKPETVIGLGIPMQQIARVIIKGGEIPDAGYQLLNEVLEVEKVSQVYDQRRAGPVTNLMRERDNQQFLANHKKEFLDMYIRIGMRNPFHYVSAYVEQTKGYWYHPVQNWIYYHQGVGTPNELGLERKSQFPVLVDDVLDKCLKGAENLFYRYSSLALNTYLLFVCLLYAIVKKKKIFIYIPHVGVFLTLMISTPVWAEFRYAYSLLIGLPLLMGLTFFSRDSKES